MVAQKVRFWNSIVSRFALFITGLLLFAILLSGYLVFRKSSTVIIDFAKERIRHSAELAEQSFYSTLVEVSNDIAVISSSLALQNFVNHPDGHTTEVLNRLFEVMLINKPAYFQIRFIDSSGLEVIRFDKIAGRVQQASSGDLQQKGDRDYFQEALQIQPGAYYYSKINLNEEYGVISEPPTVTLRAASPVADQNQQKCGIVIINVDLTAFYEELDRISTSGTHFYLIDNQGQYLYEPEHGREFGLQRGTGYTFYQDFKVNIISNDTMPGEYQDTEGNPYLYLIRQFDYFNGQREAFLIASIKEADLLESARSVRRESLQSLALVCLVSLLLSYFFTRLFSRQINLVTRAISSYEQGERDTGIPVHRNDEIGVLARSFAAMRQKIDETLADLNTALKEEKKAKIQRDEFLQNMSHELRTPLHAIQGLTQLLRKNKPSEAQMPIIQSLERSVNNLTGLVYDVLDHQKLVEGKLTIHLKPTNIAHLLEDIYGNYQFDAVRKGLEFSHRISPALYKQEYHTDALRLSQIVINLVVNAIKYTEKGRVMLTAELTGNEQAVLEIRVEDTGIGIHQENLERINDRFFQESKEISGRYGGYGLGLSIVKQLVILFGGQLIAESRKEAGSRFTVRIPVVPVMDVDQLVKEPVSVYNLPVLKNHYRILQIDDDPSTREMVVLALDPKQFELMPLTRIDDLENILVQFSPHLIISDLMLADRNISPDLLELQRRQEISCPVIVVSALDPPALNKVSAYWFQKPFDLHRLIDRIYQLTGSQEFPVPDFKEIAHNYDQNQQKINRVLEILEIEFQVFIGRLEDLLTSSSLAEWQSIAHKLITHTRTLALHELTDILEQNHTIPAPQDLKRLQHSLRYALCCIRLKKST
jgi:two-component system, sensor histidine kinase